MALNLNQFLTEIGFTAKYPYTDIHELNLDWCLSQIATLRVEFDNFAHVNSLKYAGEWDITKAYSAFSVVDDNGFGYMALKPVPPGTQINDTEYWLMVVDYSQILNNYETRITNLETTVGDASSGLVKDIDDLKTTVGDASSGLVKDVDDLKTTVGDASSGLVKDVDDLQNDMTTAQSDIGALQGTVGDASSGLVKDVDDLQSDVSALQGTVGDASSGLVKDVDDLRTDVDSLLTGTNRFYIFQSDSYGIPDPHGYNSWIQNVIAYLGIVSDQYRVLDNNSGGFVDPGDYGTFEEQLETYLAPDPSKVSHVIVAAGANDRDENPTDVKNAVASYIRRAKALYPNANVYVSCIGWSTTGSYAHEIYNVSYQMYKQGCVENGGIWMESPCDALLFSSDFYDYLHPSEDGHKKIARAVVNEIMGLSSIVSYDRSISCTESTGFTFDYPIVIKANQRGSQYNVRMSTGYDRISITANANLSRDSWSELGTTDDTFCSGGYGAQMDLTAWIRDSGNNDHYVPSTIRIVGGKIYFKPTVTINNARLIIIGCLTTSCATHTGVD